MEQNVSATSASRELKISHSWKLQRRRHDNDRAGARRGYDSHVRFAERRVRKMADFFALRGPLVNALIYTTNQELIAGADRLQRCVSWSGNSIPCVPNRFTRLPA